MAPALGSPMADFEFVAPVLLATDLRRSPGLRAWLMIWP